MNKFTGIFTFLLLIAAISFSVPMHAFAAGSLDGKMFYAVIDGVEDTLTFKNGQFHSSSCDKYGFGDGDYTTQTTADGIAFEATTTSKKDGTMVWSGTVSGDRLKGKYHWSKKSWLWNRTKDQEFEATLK